VKAQAPELEQALELGQVLERALAPVPERVPEM
jgi:hypothetical protein